ncbi:MAG: carbohydrate kinase family protein [Anaerolineales bacterium]|nr:carbohydrate kinase family protein [Anaerolineales bacterium]
MGLSAENSFPSFNLPPSLKSRDCDIAAIGNAKLEMVVQVPNWPEPGGQHDVSMSRPVYSAGGCATNVACLAARFGARTRLIARMGDGIYSRQVQTELERSSVDPVWTVPVSKSEGNLLIITTDPSGDWMVLSYMDPALELRLEDIPPESDFQSTKILHIDGFSLVTPQQKQAIETAVEKAHNSGCLVSIDAAVPVSQAQPEYLAQLFSRCDFVFVNQAEAMAVTRAASIEKAVQALQGLGPQLCCLKMGKEGAWVITPDQTARIPAFPVQVVDTLAAGDSFIAALLTALCRGYTLFEAARWGSAAGALACTGPGSLSKWFSINELLILLNTEQPSEEDRG